MPDARPITPYAITFGTDHAEIHADLGLHDLANSYVVIEAPNVGVAALLAYALFKNGKYAFIYDLDHILDQIKRHPSWYVNGEQLRIGWLRGGLAGLNEIRDVVVDLSNQHSNVYPITGRN